MNIRQFKLWRSRNFLWSSNMRYELKHELLNSIPMGRYEEMSGGHLLPLEVPDRVANCLLKN